MKSGMPWNLRGVDEETREAVYEAARRAGLTVGQWLNATVGDDDSAHDEEIRDHRRRARPADQAPRP